MTRIHKLHPYLSPADTCLFLDVDGTLVDLGPDPGAVSLDALALKFLQAVRDALDGAVAII
ncbi:MAG: trehalose-phosphatase, partial [Steroidobacteraceae bacterium]